MSNHPWGEWETIPKVPKTPAMGWTMTTELALECPRCLGLMDVPVVLYAYVDGDGEVVSYSSSGAEHRHDCTKTRIILGPTPADEESDPLTLVACALCGFDIGNAPTAYEPGGGLAHLDCRDELLMTLKVEPPV